MANVLTGVGVSLLLIVAISQILGVRYFGVLSASMEPAIPVGSLVVSAPPSLAGAYQAGDVVSYVADENLNVVTHRIVSVNQASDTLVTQGDANVTSDPAILEANVVGKVVFVTPLLGYAAISFSTPSAKIVFVSLLIAFILLSFLLSAVKGHKKKRLVITFDDESELTPEAFAEIQKRFSEKNLSGNTVSAPPRKEVKRQ
ncbi:MAG: signal peptidase I [Raoultibacter sp.]